MFCPDSGTKRAQPRKEEPLHARPLLRFLYSFPSVSLYCAANNGPAAQLFSAGAVLWNPPLTEENWPLAVLSCPPLTDEAKPLPVFSKPPLTEALGSLAVFLWPPLTE